MEERRHSPEGAAVSITLTEGANKETSRSLLSTEEKPARRKDATRSSVHSRTSRLGSDDIKAKLTWEHYPRIAPIPIYAKEMHPCGLRDELRLSNLEITTSYGSSEDDSSCNDDLADIRGKYRKGRPATVCTVRIGMQKYPVVKPISSQHPEHDLVLNSSKQRRPHERPKTSVVRISDARGDVNVAGVASHSRTQRVIVSVGLHNYLPTSPVSVLARGALSPLSFPSDVCVAADPQVVDFIRQMDEIRCKLEQQMRDCLYCSITWPEDGSGRIRLACCVPPDHPGADALVQDWAEKCDAALRVQLNAYKETDIEIDSSLWSNLMSWLSSNKYRWDALLRVEGTNNVIHLCGLESTVHKWSEAIAQKTKELSEALAKSSEQLSRTLPLKPFQKTILRATYSQKDDVDVKFDDNGIVVTARADMLEAVLTHVHSIMAEIAKIHLKGRSPALCALLKRAEVTKQIHTCFATESLVATYTSEDRDIRVYGRSKMDAQQAVEIIYREIPVKTFNLDSTEAFDALEIDWQSLMQNLQREFRLFDIDLECTKSVTVVAVKEEFEKVATKVDDFICNKKIQENFVPMSEAIVELLENHAKLEIDGILKNVRQDKSVELELKWVRATQGRPGCRVRGTVAALASASQRLAELAGRVRKQDYTEDQGYMIRFLLKEETRLLIDNIATKRSIVIRYTDVPDATAGVVEEQADPSMVGADERMHVVTAATGLSIKLLVGDVTRHPVDVMITANSATLDHAGGAAGAFIKAGGKKIKTECAEYIKQNGSLAVGAAYISTAGKLPCRVLVHTVGPVWGGGAHKEEQGLELALLTALKEASKNIRHKIVSLPFISGGICKFPKTKGAWTIVKTVAEYLAKGSTAICEVHIVCWSEGDAKYFVSELMKLLQGGLVRRMQVRCPLGERSSNFVDDHEDTSAQWKRSLEEHASGCIMTKEGVKLSIVKGFIEQQKVDAIFCSCVNSELDLNYGDLAMAVLAAAGRKLQTELNANYSNGLQPGQVGKTTGYRLDCTSVYFAHVPEWDTEDTTASEQLFRTILRETLKLASEGKLTSIAWPTVGCGGLNYPKAVVAAAMFDEVRLFSAANQNSSLCDVRIVVLEQNASAIEALEIELFAAGADCSVTQTDYEEEELTEDVSEEYGPPSAAHPLVLSLFALTAGDTNTALTDIKQLHKRKVIGGTNRATILELNIDQESKIRSLQRKYDVGIVIDKQLGLIRLKGDPIAISEAQSEVHDILTEITPGQVWWEFKDADGIFQPFDHATGYEIEKAFRSHKRTIDCRSDDKTYRISFGDMTREIVGESSTKCTVNRQQISEGSILIPSNWAPMPVEQTYLLVELDTEHKEYRAVITHLDQPTLDIVKVERIQNPSLYRLYMTKKQMMDSVSGTTTANERRLWHGTAGESVANINEEGFNRSYCGKNGVAYGDGAYFAVDSSYSVVSYCPPDNEELQYIYQARVLTGRFTQGEEGMKAPPALPDRANAHYDSAVDDVEDPSMFVVFHDVYTYPEYLITFQENYPESEPDE